MEFISPVINHVHNKTNVSLIVTLKAHRFALPAKKTTVLDFDMASIATGTEKTELFRLVSEGYIDVDIMVAKDGEYTKAGVYTVKRSDVKAKAVEVKPNPNTTDKRAKELGVKVTETKVAEKAVSVVPEEKTDVIDPRTKESTKKPQTIKANTNNMKEPVAKPVEEPKAEDKKGE